MEFYPGWIDTWGLNHSTVNTSDVLQGMTAMYELGASFNFYVFHGGTNFGYFGGSVGRRPCTTSYDYDAPLDESGDPTPKYVAIRNHIEALTGIKNPLPMPEASPKRAYGEFEMTWLGSVLDLQYMWVSRSVSAQNPLTFEEMDFPYGFILYETVISIDASGFNGSGNLTVNGIRDRGYVLVDGEIQGIVSNMDKEYSLDITAQTGSKLQILVENNGRHTKGSSNRKGIISNVTLDGHRLTNWTMYPIVMEDLVDLVRYETPHVLEDLRKPKEGTLGARSANGSFVPSFYYAKFSLEEKPLDDTFLHTGNWSKGHVFINEFNLGRYWPALGPQVTLYVPKTVLKPRSNHVLMFELMDPGNCIDSSLTKCSISFIDYPILDRMVPGTVILEPF